MYEIGKIATTHGIKGEVKVISYSDFDRFIVNEKMFVLINNEKIEFVIEKVRAHKEGFIVKFKGYDNINDVLAFHSLILYSDERGELLENEFYFEMLIGLNAFTTTDELIGEVTDVIEVPQGHLLEITSTVKKHLVPFVDEFIKLVDDEKIVIQPIEGLL